MKNTLIAAFVLGSVGCGYDIPVANLEEMIKACDGNDGAVSISIDTQQEPVDMIKQVNCVDGAIFKSKYVL